MITETWYQRQKCIYTELYDKFVLMFMQALFKTFYNEVAAEMEVTIKKRDKDDG